MANSDELIFKHKEINKNIWLLLEGTGSTKWNAQGLFLYIGLGCRSSTLATLLKRDSGTFVESGTHSGTKEISKKKIHFWCIELREQFPLIPVFSSYTVIY